MFQRILVPLDGSERAESALSVAVRLARASNGSIVLLRAIMTSFEYMPAVATAQQISITQTVADSDLEEAERYLAQLTVMEALEDIPTETVVLFGSTAPTILSVAYAYNADLIVLCSHGYTGMKRWVMGSVAEKVVHHSSIPVLVLREGGPKPTHGHLDPTQPMRVMVTLDGSTYANAALQPAISLLDALSETNMGALHLVRIVRGTPDIQKDEKLQHEHQQMMAKARTDMQTIMEHIREGWAAKPTTNLKLSITWSVQSAKDVAEAILRATSGEDAEIPGPSDLLVMATHGYGGLQRWTMGSTTERIINATKLPVLVIRPSEVTKHVDNQPHVMLTQ